MNRYFFKGKKKTPKDKNEFLTLTFTYLMFLPFAPSVSLKSSVLVDYRKQ